MASSGEEMKESLTFRIYPDRDREGEIDLEPYKRFADNIWQAGWSHKCPTYVHRTPPCQAACPCGHDVRGWLDIVRGMEKPTGDLSVQEYAFRRATESNPFPAVMGRVCPAPCEDGCNRNQVDEQIGINSIEQYIGDQALEKGFTFAKPEHESGKRVAIIGGGPAGLAAAFHLRRKGHACTVFEAAKHLGGMIRYGIPGYRTPRELLDAEINRIIDMGVEVKTNTRVGTDIPMAQIEADFDAVFWAIGAQSGRGLSVPGGDATNCITGVAFLNAFNDGRLHHVNGRVVVIGGGDTSIDVASVARRLGKVETTSEKDRVEHVVLGQTAHDVATAAKKEGAEVMLITRRPIEQMAAAQKEIDDALREGVEIRGSLAPVEVIRGSDGRATALRVCGMEIVDGKYVCQEGSEFDIEADLIVSAIGQMGDFTGFEDFANERGLMDADRNYQVPGKPGHFVGGDVLKPHLLTTAVGHARIAAESIDSYLKNEEAPRRAKLDVNHFSLLEKLKESGLEPAEIHEPVFGTDQNNIAVHNYEDRGNSEVISHNKLFLGHFQRSSRIRRHEIEVSADNVLGHFDERLVGLSDEEATKESDRCMSCGMCFECDNCIIYCPQIAVKKTKRTENTTGRYVETDYDKCIGCHICADVCPTGYIDMALGE